MDEQRKEMQAGMAMMNQMQGGGVKGGMGAGHDGSEGQPTPIRRCR